MISALDEAWGSLGLAPTLKDKLEALANQGLTEVAVASSQFSFSAIFDRVAMVRSAFESLPWADDPGEGARAWQHEAIEILSSMEADIATRWRSTLRGRVRGIYFIVDPQVTDGRDPVEVAGGALRGGAHMIQLRDKQRDKGRTLPLARAIAEMCRAHGALFIMNDHADVGRLCDADGLHVGQSDLPVADARILLKPQQLVGRSNHWTDEALESEAQGADHVAVGPIYPTTTKETSNSPAGLDRLSEVKEAVSVPVVAIGGINEENLTPLIWAGADAVCVSSAIGLAPDPEEATRGLVQRMADAGGKI